MRTKLNFIAIIIAVIVYFGIGALWYSPILFGDLWLSMQSFATDNLNPSPAIYIRAIFLTAIAVFSLAIFMAVAGVTSVPRGIIMGVGAGLGFVLTTLGITFIFENKPVLLVFIDALYHVVGLGIAGAIIGSMQKKSAV